MTCGITVAPMMPDARSTLSAPSKRGTSPAASGAGLGRVDEQPGQEADRDQHEEHHDHALEGALAANVTDPQDEDRDGRGDERAEQQRQVEQQVQGDRAADDLREVGGDGDGLGLQPVRRGEGRGSAAGRRAWRVTRP